MGINLFEQNISQMTLRRKQPEKENKEESQNRRTKNIENPKLLQNVLSQAIERIENKESEEKNRRIAEEMRKRFLKKYSDVFKEKLERGDKVRCLPVKIETIKNL